MGAKRPIIDRNVLYDFYITQQMSFTEISKITGIDQASLRYRAKKEGIPIRNRKEAQKLSQETGRAYNPTKGTSLPPEMREKIAQKVSEHWESLSDDDKEAHRQRCKENAAKDPDRMKRFTDAGKKAQKRVSKEGSNLEAYLVEQLTLLGYWVEAHKKHAIQSENMHIDILLRKEKIAIEVDGPTHLRPVYSQEDFEKKREKDIRKNGLLLQDGYSVIRVGVERARSLAAKAKLLQEVLDGIEEAKNNPNTIIYKGLYN